MSNNITTKKDYNLPEVAKRPGDNVMKSVATGRNDEQVLKHEENISLEEKYKDKTCCCGRFYFGWLLVLGIFFMHVFTIGGMYSSSVLILSWQAEFNTDRKTVSIPASIPTMFFTLTGPIAGMITDRFGYRCTGLIGTIAVAMALLIGSYAESIIVLSICYGAFYGIGLCCLWLPGTTLLQTYFSKRKALAVGLAVSGAGFGTAIVPNLWVALINSYGWRIALRISAIIWTIANLLAITIYQPPGTTNW